MYNVFYNAASFFFYNAVIPGAGITNADLWGYADAGISTLLPSSQLPQDSPNSVPPPGLRVNITAC